jgi:hypothetical protein
MGKETGGELGWLSQHCQNHTAVNARAPVMGQHLHAMLVLELNFTLAWVSPLP